MRKPKQVKAGSANVFADLGVARPQEALAKAELAARICDAIRERKLTQAQAAAKLGVDQPKISALQRGRLTGFSTERLLRFLNALDRDVDIVIKKKGRAKRPARIRVVAG